MKIYISNLIDVFVTKIKYLAILIFSASIMVLVYRYNNLLP